MEFIFVEEIGDVFVHALSRRAGKNGPQDKTTPVTKKKQ